MNLKKFLSKIEWPNLLFLTVAHIGAAVGVFLLFSRDQFPWETAVLALLMTVATGLSITVGYHRLFAHKSFSAHWAVRLLALLFGAAAYQNTALRWASDHRRHHKFVDTDKDPYNIKRGFFYAHIGWVLLKDDTNPSCDDVPDLERDPLVRFQHRFYLPLSILFSFALPTAIAALWSDPWGGFFIAGWLRLTLNEHFTFFINSLAHMWGPRPYSDSDTSRDNAALAFLTYGEGYHNFHHTFPFDYRNGIRPWQWDPSKWVIFALSKFNLAGNLKRSPNNVVLRSRLKMDEKKILNILEKGPHPAAAITRDFISRSREKFELAHARWQEVHSRHERLKNEKLPSLTEPMSAIRHEFNEAKIAAIVAMDAWHKICHEHGISPTPAWV